MPNIELWFPVAIYQEHELFSKEQNDIWAERILSLQKRIPNGGKDWYGNTYNTHGTYDLRKDDIFKPLVDTLTDRVNQFARFHNCTGSYECKYGWANVSDHNSFQEFHTHNGSIFSLAYYVTAPEGSGRIIFEDPKEPDMRPLKDIKDRNEYSFIKVAYPPKQGTLIIFRSYLRHLVEPGTNSTPRISVSMNFS